MEGNAAETEGGREIDTGSDGRKAHARYGNDRDEAINTELWHSARSGRAMVAGSCHTTFVHTSLPYRPASRIASN
jgi:hypothetical protein